MRFVRRRPNQRHMLFWTGKFLSRELFEKEPHFFFQWVPLLRGEIGIVAYSTADSAVSVVTRYGLDGWEIEHPCGRDFPHPFRQSLGRIQAAVNWIPSFFLGSKAAGAGSGPHTPI
jgi:hypothetical protein